MNHRDVKPHCCTFCNASYSQKSRLQIHIRKHQGVKPFACEVCNKLFTEKGNLNVHMKSHMKGLRGAPSSSQEISIRAKTIGVNKLFTDVQTPD